MGFSLFPKNLKQWKVVVIAFASATTFWFFNALNKEYATSLKLPVDFVYDTDSLVAIKSLPEEIKVDVEGVGWNLIRRTSWFNPKPIQISLADLTQLSFISWIEMLPAIRDQADEINIKQVLQDTLRIQLEPYRTRDLAVRVDSSSIDLDKNHYIVSPIQILTDSITIRGPLSFIDTLGENFVFSIPDEGIDGDYREMVTLPIRNKRIVQIKPHEVEVRFQVRQFVEELVFTTLDYRNFEKWDALLPERVTVYFLKSKAAPNTYTEEDFSVVADLAYYNAADSTLPLQIVNYPASLHKVSVAPDTIKWTPGE